MKRPEPITVYVFNNFFTAFVHASNISLSSEDKDPSGTTEDQTSSTEILPGTKPLNSTEALQSNEAATHVAPSKLTKVTTSGVKDLFSIEASPSIESFQSTETSANIDTSSYTDVSTSIKASTSSEVSTTIKSFSTSKVLS